ncbi:MAG: hypothetical protein CL878_12630 [Dehalococcoidia bacterium]|nr:hypothetical protein [Dehalococcoidia bacterium]
MPLWKDPWARWLALLGLTINVALALGLLARLPQLPDLLPVHFNAFGEVDLIGAKRDILRLPVIGALVWAANVALAVQVARLDRLLARLLIGAAVLVPVLFALAAFRLIA